MTSKNTDSLTGEVKRVELYTTNNDYRYKTFTTQLLLGDMRFHKSAPKAGEPFPDFKLETTDGNVIWGGVQITKSFG